MPPPPPLCCREATPGRCSLPRHPRGIPHPPSTTAAQKGADLQKLGVCAAVGVALWLMPPPHGVAPSAWHLLAIFCATIAGMITMPLPFGAVALLGLTAAMLTGTLEPAAAFAAFASEVPWLVAASFFLSGGIIRSGLGARIAYGMVALFGGTTLVGAGHSCVRAPRAGRPSGADAPQHNLAAQLGRAPPPAPCRASHTRWSLPRRCWRWPSPQWLRARVASCCLSPSPSASRAASPAAGAAAPLSCYRPVSGPPVLFLPGRRGAANRHLCSPPCTQGPTRPRVPSGAWAASR